MKLSGTYFYGNQASAYAIQNGYLDYATLAKAFDAVLNNTIRSATYEDWEMESGWIDNSEKIEELENQAEELESLITENSSEEEDQKTSEKIEELKEKIQELEDEQNESYYPESYQDYIVSDNGAEILKEAGEIVWYNSNLDMYIWSVTHYGTSWSYVLTNIKLNCGEDAYR